MSYQGTINAGQRVPMAISGRYLTVRGASGEVFISNADMGLGETPIRKNDVADLLDMGSVPDFVYLQNKGAAPIELDIVTSQLRLATNDVTISGGAIDRINESIQVTASATVENGTMHVIPGGSLVEQADIPIPAGTKVKVATANALRKALLVQVISATKTQLRVGGVMVNAGRGALLVGSLGAPASMPVETNGDVWLYNESAEAATVAIIEVLQ